MVSSAQKNWLSNSLECILFTNEFKYILKMSAIFGNFNWKGNPISVIIEVRERKNSNAAFGQYWFALNETGTKQP